MTDTCMNDDHDSDNEHCDQQEIESYLYSLVHHVSVENESQQGLGEEILPLEDDDTTPAAYEKTWRYFNATPGRNRGENFKRFERPDFRSVNRELQKSFVWRKPLHSIIRSKITAMGANRNKTNKSAPDVTSIGTNSSNSANCLNTSEIIYIDDESRNISEHDSTLKSKETSSPDITLSSSSTGDLGFKGSNQVISNCSTTGENVEKNDNSSQVPSQESDEIKDDLNNTNPSLSSFDDCFEPPSMPKSKSALNESMTQALQVMLDDDASRSSIESSDKRPVPISKVSAVSKPSSGSGWTVGMSWEDMSSKFRFNFEVDSVCGDSVREGSISASSRANTPEAAVIACPEDVSKYDVALKSKTSTDGEVHMDFDNSDSEAESVIEVVKPPKEPPPIFELSSDNEDDPPSKISKLDNTPQEVDNKPGEMEEDIVVLYETLTPDQKSNGLENSVSADALNIYGTPPLSRAERRRERNRKKESVAKAQAEPCESRPQRFDPDNGLQSILAGMSDDPSLWRLCKEDIYPRPAWRNHRPCSNCKQRDHLTSHCKEPVKLKVCSACAGPGHNASMCPNRMCLNCGRRAYSFVRGCLLCSRKTVCDICSWTGHQSQQCPDLWRRYHLTTRPGPPVAPTPRDLRRRGELWCCNCAKKGHISDTCRSPVSDINEKRLSLVVSYEDPTQVGHDKNHQSAASETVALPSKESVQSSASIFNSQEQNSKGKSSGLVAKFTNHPQFKKNYQIVKSKLLGHDRGLPSKASALADFLEGHLELLKKPVLSDREVRVGYIKLMETMKSAEFSKKKCRKACKLASELNMTVIGFGKLAEGDHLISYLRKEIELLRNCEENTKVFLLDRIRISTCFSQLFKGLIRDDIDQSVSEYLKQRQSGSL